MSEQNTQPATTPAVALSDLLGVNPVHKDVVGWIDSRNPDAKTRKAFIAHFEGWSDEKQFEMARDVEIRKLEAFKRGVEDILKPTWWERVLSWIGL